MAHQVKLLSLSAPLILIISMLFWGGGVAQSDDCTNVILTLSPCLTYVSGNSSAPSAACCTQLGSTSRTQPQCLCQALNGGGSNLGLNINQTQALALPKACNIQTPPPTQCKVAAASPSGSPGNSGGGTGNGSSDGNSNKFTLFSVLFFLVFTASYVAIFNMP